MAEYTKEIFKTEKGYGYKILRDGIPVVIQDFKPHVEGWQAMTKEEAEKFAEETLQYFKSLKEVE